MMPLLEELSSLQILNHLTEISQRQFPQAGHRQVPFNIVETLLCYGLFYLLDPHKYGYMEKVLSRVCHDSWCKSENKMSSKINQAELAFVLILGVCPRLEPKARVGNHAAREGKATTQKIVIATQATTMR
jgi:hypothetical protein